MKIAQRIAANGPLGVQIVKKLAVETSHLAPADFILASNDAWGLLRDTTDRIDGRVAFGENESRSSQGTDEKGAFWLPRIARLLSNVLGVFTESFSTSRFLSFWAGTKPQYRSFDQNWFRAGRCVNRPESCALQTTGLGLGQFFSNSPLHPFGPFAQALTSSSQLPPCAALTGRFYETCPTVCRRKADA